VRGDRERRTSHPTHESTECEQRAADRTRRVRELRTAVAVVGATSQRGPNVGQPSHSMLPGRSERWPAESFHASGPLRTLARGVIPCYRATPNVGRRNHPTLPGPSERRPLFLARLATSFRTADARPGIAAMASRTMDGIAFPECHSSPNGDLVNGSPVPTDSERRSGLSDRVASRLRTSGESMAVAGQATPNDGRVDVPS
jgi:hypothetical protein